MLCPDSNDELQEKRICFECVGETFLSEEINHQGIVAQCSYCGETAQTYTIEEIADRVETAFADHYRRTSGQPSSWQQSLLSDRESSYNWYRDGEPVGDAIENAAQISSAAASDIQELLDERHGDIESAKLGEETEFSAETYYEERGSSDEAWQEEWSAFERSLQTEARFFNPVGASHLASVFGDIDKLWAKDGKPLVVDAGPKFLIDHLYRARVFQSNDKLKEALCRPDLHVGSPPAAYASAGRMNARGISVFYGATEAGVTIAEVRPPVGSNVAVAKFNIIRPLRLLDLTALGEVEDGGSIFDPSLRRRMERVAFLQTLEEKMSRPVMPDDEAFEYLVTQAIADFLATANKPRLDGIVFRSAQSEIGRNVVLFHKAARVEALQFPKDTKIEAQSGHHTGDGWEVEYAVSETVPPPLPSPQIKDNNDWPLVPFLPRTEYSEDSDFRDNTLQVDPASVEVHEVEWVKYQCAVFKVERRRNEKRSRKF